MKPKTKYYMHARNKVKYYMCRPAGKIYRVYNQRCYIYWGQWEEISGPAYTSPQGKKIPASRYYGLWSQKAWRTAGYKRIPEEEVFLYLLNK